MQIVTFTSKMNYAIIKNWEWERKMNVKERKVLIELLGDK